MAAGAGPGRLGHPATIAFAAALAVSAALLIALQADLTFRLDDWAFLLYRRFPGFEQVLVPHNEHIVVAPVLIYKALVAGFGTESAAPFQVVSTLIFAAVAALMFVFCRRRVGGWLALAAILPVLFLGTAAEDLLWPFQIGFTGTLAAGIGALIALERDDRRGDLAACALLVVAVAFSSLWLPFAAAAAVIVGWDGRRIRRAYVVVVPAVVYGLWWLGWGHEGESHFALNQLPHVPVFVIKGFAASAASLTGLGQAQENTTVDHLVLGGLLLGAVLAVALWRLPALRRPSRSLVAVIVAALAFWILAGASATVAGRAADVSRYQLPGVVLLLLIAAEALRGVRAGPRTTIAVLALALLATASNLGSLIREADSLEGETEIERADLAALEIARDRVVPQFELTPELAATDFTAGVRADVYFPFIDESGSPALPISDLPTAPEAARVQADRVIAAALGLTVEPGSDASPAGARAPRLEDPGAVEARQRGACVSVRPSSPRPVTLSLPEGGALVRSDGDSPLALSLRRYATGSFPVGAGSVAPHTATALPIPVDRSPEPWKLGVDARSRFSVCGLR